MGANLHKQRIPRPVLRLATCYVMTLVVGCAHSDKPVLFVAASLADVAGEWQEAYGKRFDYHFAASHLLAAQIRAGAHADLLLAAGPTVLAGWQEAGLVYRLDSCYLENRLVLVTAPGVEPPVTLSDLREQRFARIALPDPELAPAGSYARAGLERAGLWEALRPKLIFTGDVRMAAETARLATADAAFVYATDLSALPAARTLTLDTLYFRRARYPLALLSPPSPALDSLWDYLHSPAARRAAYERGFR